MIRAAETPGPNQYDMAKYSGTYGMSGGKFNESRPKSEIELIQYRASQTPGPNQYGFADVPDRMKGGRISTAKPKTDTEILAKAKAGKFSVHFTKKRWKYVHFPWARMCWMCVQVMFWKVTRKECSHMF